ncbi:MAG: molybdopterin converting factor subunit 1 [Myxococcales bacterium]|jgi:molybdopterin converting factor subunit 1
MADQVQVTVLYFASARESAGMASESLRLDAPATVQALRGALVARHAALGSLLPRLRFAVNQQMATDETPLNNGDEVALIPPVAGGSGAFALTDKPLSLQAVIEAVEGPGMGGIVTFTGNVRDHSEGKRVLRLEYEAYAPMALASLEQIAAEIGERWPGTRVAIHHRTGALEIGEAAVVIACAAAHRKEAFLACEYAIDRLKEVAPIWKKEFFENGARWVEPR